MQLDNLLSRPLHVVTGKGGVGKSLIATALAKLAQREGRRVLLVDIDARNQATRLLDLPPADATETEIEPGLWLLNVELDSLMTEFVRSTVKLPFVADKLVASPVYRYFVAAAPGLRELMTLGKVWHVQTAASDAPRYDVVVVDAPASGHALSLLRVPEVIESTVRVGPVAGYAQQIRRLLSDDAYTWVHLVTLPEELPVSETLEVDEELRRRGITVGTLTMNCVWPRLFSAKQEAWIESDAAIEGPAAALARSARAQIRRRRQSARYIERLQSGLDRQAMQLPYLPRETLGPDEVSELVDLLADELAEAEPPR